MAVDVLIVDDSAAIRKILQRMLGQAGLDLGEVFEAGDGLEALEKMRSHGAHLILSDIGMPNMDGMQLLRELKSSAQYRHVPVIMIAADGGEDSVLDAVQLGAAGYVRKPFTAEQIKGKLSALFLGTMRAAR
jgi:two-component system chemotaxis response regulator CheY